MHTQNTLVSCLGWIGCGSALLMNVSFLDQIRLNLGGHHGSFILPAIATINCVCWATYGSLSRPRIWPMIVCNLPGVPLALVTVITSFT